jgi:Cysteine-rich CPXCG
MCILGILTRYYLNRSIAVRHAPTQIMRRRQTHSLELLRRRITRLDTASIDELYGLEPVWEPAAGRRVSPEEFVAVRCPYCGERLETRVDLSAQEPAYVEDCEVCCRPIEFHIERDAGGALAALEVRRLD